MSNPRSPLASDPGDPAGSTRYRDHRWTMLPAWVTGSAPWLAALTAVLAWVLSYTAQVQLALAHRYAPWEAALWPLTTDMASLVLMIIALDAADTRRRGATVRAAGLSLLAAGVMVVGNGLIAWPDLIAVAQHTWPPLIGACIWFVLAHDRPRRAPGRWDGAPLPDPVQLGADEARPLAALPESLTGPSRESSTSRKSASRNQTSQKSLSRNQSSRNSLSRNLGRPPAHQPPPDLDDVIARMLGRGASITASSLAQELGVGRATAGRYLQQRRAVPQERR